ncbi:MAG TPA: NB-ARC domain-containing protein [Roseiflexaceae bacterium]|nr:NB-ARC domain-containing protein [Roseiflexaceae bacterium]
MDDAPDSLQQPASTPAFQNRDVQVAGNLMQAGGGIYINSLHVEAGGSGVLINNIRVEYRWTRPRPPQLLRPMISRQTDLDTARARLLQHGALAITGAPAMGIQGMPGVGKTTLAQQLALMLDQDYPDGVIWQAVGPDIQTPEQVQPILKQWASYALIIPADLNAAQFEAGAVRALLAEHPRLLVVLDNVWSLEAIRPLREALPPEAHLVITTRSRNVLIALGHGYELDVLSLEDAHRLVALRLGWGQTVPPEQQAWCDALIQGVGFHTLALDVALGVLRREGDTPEEWRATAERLVQYLRVGRDFADLSIPEAERELHVERVLAYSYERMDPDAQRCFRLLGALAPDADFATAAAGALWEQDEATTRRSLTAFVNAALLTRSGSGRWQQHALLRGYALALLRRAGDHELALARHAAHYAAAMEHAVKASLVSTMLPEQPQLRHAFAWAVENDLALAFRLTEGTAELRALFGPAVEQLAWVEQLQAVARERGTAGDQARALGALGNALQRVAVAPEQERAPRLTAALSAYEEALRFYAPDTAPLDYAGTQNNRAVLLRELAGLPGEDRRGRLGEALRIAWEALGWFERLEHAPYIEIARRTLRDLHGACGDGFASLWEELGVGPVPHWLQQPASPEEALRTRLAQLGVSDQAGLQAAFASDPELQQLMIAVMLRRQVQALLSINDADGLLRFWQELPVELEEPLLATVAQAAAEAEQAGNRELAQALQARLDGLRQIQAASAQPLDEPTSEPEEPAP